MHVNLLIYFFYLLHTTSFFGQLDRFGIVEKTGSSEILQRKIFWKKEELKPKKVEMKTLNFLCEIATSSHYENQFFLILKMFVFVFKTFLKMIEYD